ncbi:hypothetical protein SAY87_005628 [Trapa incisa]|uniref:Uncharacterized protein n=1 Tax=Trapa incisa TaxID=236973 RepID=A0AAN7KCT7_9MYRT|nr:hypothetical protein SAY87_005628 [Trapa incisa]
MPTQKRQSSDNGDGDHQPSLKQPQRELDKAKEEPKEEENEDDAEAEEEKHEPVDGAEDSDGSASSNLEDKSEYSLSSLLLSFCADRRVENAVYIASLKGKNPVYFPFKLGCWILFPILGVLLDLDLVVLLILCNCVLKCDNLIYLINTGGIFACRDLLDDRFVLARCLHDSIGGSVAYYRAMLPFLRCSSLLVPPL